jgi:hypothetical protein
MVSDEKPYKYENVPIPTYEEATSSRQASQTHVGVTETGDDSERQGLLGSAESRGLPTRRPMVGGTIPRTDGYRPPTVESARNSTESDSFLPSSNGGSARGSIEEVRREMEEMEIEEPGTSRNGLRNSFSKRFTALSNTLSLIHLPRLNWGGEGRRCWPSFSFLSNIRERIGEQPRAIWINLARLIALLFVMGLVYVVFVSDLFPNVSRSGMMGQMYRPDSIKAYVQANVDGQQIGAYLDHLTEFDHSAGTEGDLALAKWVEGLFKAATLEDVRLDEYDVYLNFPKKGGRRVAIVEPVALAFEASLEESKQPHHEGDDPMLWKDSEPVFHGYSRAGNVTGPLVFANYGAREDFRYLADNGVDVKGSIVLVKYGGTQGDRVCYHVHLQI